MILSWRFFVQTSFFQLTILLAVVAGLWQVLGKLPTVLAAEKASGARVIMMRHCTDQEERDRGDSREVFVRLRDDGSIYMNEDPISSRNLLTEIQRIFSTRQERVLFLLGENSVSYQRVASTAAELQAQVQDLQIFLPTSANIRGTQFSCLVPNGPVSSY